MTELKHLRVGDIFSVNKVKYVLETKRERSVICSPIYNRHFVQLFELDKVVQFNYRYEPYNK